MKISYLPESDTKHPHREFKLRQLLPLQMPKRNRGYILTSQGAKKLTEAKREWETQHENRCTQEKIRQLTRTLKPPEGLDPGTIRKILKGEKGVDKESILCLFIAFSLQLDDDDLEQVKQNDVPNLISSSIKESETGEDLMSLATSMLEELGFNRYFNINRTSQYIGYRPKDLKFLNKGYEFILMPHEKALSICILKKIVEPYLLKFIFMCNDEEDGTDCILVGQELFWLAPSKEDIFFKINTQYNYSLNSWDYGESIEECYLHPFKGEIISQEEFESDEFEEFQNKNITFYKHKSYFEALINSKCCLHICENSTFSYAWEICINSSEVLQEFINYMEEMLMSSRYIYIK
ncbi:hypothetical protein NDI37_00360 [Funiculus sociatus GB2-A5]|uniref:Uncharacterized protein n=1 Tax=Funiculus sociatus GB2-A5 TaxID=2933946 RepID=A0ABV0JHK6_9CYAN|nr:hypothetical protein [Trichocoleus sp. FACHB-6]MBD2064361.1 hypothetical protein [Trichocoleus sp. FACHB-6]